jgi:hypothetical protein
MNARVLLEQYLQSPPAQPPFWRDPRLKRTIGALSVNRRALA